MAMLFLLYQEEGVSRAPAPAVESPTAASNDSAPKTAGTPSDKAPTPPPVLAQ